MALELVGQPKPPLELPVAAELSESDFVEVSAIEHAADMACVPIILPGLRYSPVEPIPKDRAARDVVLDLADKLEALSEASPEARELLYRLSDYLVYAWDKSGEIGADLTRDFLSERLDPAPYAGQLALAYDWGLDEGFDKLPVEPLFVPYPRDSELVEQPALVG